MNVLTFDRLTLDALYGFSVGVPINLSNQDGRAARDWFHPPSNTLAGMADPIRKTGANLLAVTILGADQGSGVSMVPNTFTWSDGPVGSSSHAHRANTQTVGNGFQVTCPAPVWPDWSLLKFWDYASNPWQIAYDASMDDAAAVTMAAYVGGSSLGADEIYQFSGVAGNRNKVTTVRFSSQEAGKTLTFRARRNGLSIGAYNLLAVGLYVGAPTASYSRSQNALTHSGKFAPLSGDGIDFV